MELRPLVIAELSPPLNAVLVQNTLGLQELAQWLNSLQDKILGLDLESNVTATFWNRRARTLQIGNKDKQFVIDFLSFAGSEAALISSQGDFGKNNAHLYKEIFDVLSPVLESNAYTKVGVNLGFDYELLRWNFGVRMWNLFSCDLAERVIEAGRTSLKLYSAFSMESMVERYFHLQIDKSQQTSFDLCSPLTQKQINYGALDVRLPLALRSAQLRALTTEGLLATTQIENDAIPAFADMHLHGQCLDNEKWMKRIEYAEKERVEYLKELDAGFIPLVGSKTTAIDYNELDRLEKIWREDFELPTKYEEETAIAIRLEKDKTKKDELRAVLKNQKQLRTQKKAEAKAAFSTLSKLRTKNLKIIEGCLGQAFVNYDSNAQLLAALKKLPKLKNLASVGDDELLKYNDNPLIQILRKWRKSSKTVGTYGEAWAKQWITKPCKEEGYKFPDGKIHCQHNQLEAETGRPSSSKPNAYNLPKEESVRECFVATEGFEIVTCDMSGCELRILAELSQAISWLKAFNLKWDVHALCTEILYPEKWPTLTAPGCTYFALGEDGNPQRKKCKCEKHLDLRDDTKTFNFQIVYGGGPPALADALDISLDAAKDMLNLHRKKFPDIWNYLDRSGESAKRNKESRDMYGRRRIFVEPTYESAKAWFIANEEEKLRLNEEECASALYAFKAKELREPNAKEKVLLTHRAPTDNEIKKAWNVMLGSIGRRGKNMPAQGTNATLAKRILGSGRDALGKTFLWHLLPQFNARIINYVYDEFIIECPKGKGQEVLACVQDAIKRAGQEIFKTITMESEGRVANCWKKG